MARLELALRSTEIVAYLLERCGVLLVTFENGSWGRFFWSFFTNYILWIKNKFVLFFASEAAKPSGNQINKPSIIMARGIRKKSGTGIYHISRTPGRHSRKVEILTYWFDLLLDIHFFLSNIFFFVQDSRKTMKNTPQRFALRLEAWSLQIASNVYALTGLRLQT